MKNCNNCGWSIYQKDSKIKIACFNLRATYANCLGPCGDNYKKWRSYEEVAQLTSIHDKGIKHDKGKTRWYLLPWKALEQIVQVMMFGADKYSDHGWQEVPKAKERYMDAAIRHLTAEMNGEEVDEESGLLHLAHAGCCILFLIWFKLKK